MEQLITIRTLEELQKLKVELLPVEFIAMDTETTGLDRESSIIGFSVAYDTAKAYYVILSYWDKEAQLLVDLETKAAAKDFMEFLASKQLIMHNATYDCIMVESNYGVKLMPSVHTDTMVLAHLLNENRAIGLKELGTSIFGEDARTEQIAMKASITANGGQITKKAYELYKADADTIALYGAKDALLTIKLFYHLVPELYEQGLEDFFYKDESMPLLRTATYDLNTTGLKVDLDALATLQRTLEADILSARDYIYKEIQPHIQEDFPGTTIKKTFNVDSNHQLAWLLYMKLDNPFHLLTKGGKELCKALNIKPPYSFAAQRAFITIVRDNKDRVWEEAKFNPKTKKMGKPKKVAEPWTYLSTGKESVAKLASKYKWLQRYQTYVKDEKILSTYVLGLQERQKYGIIRPGFKQCGTSSGRYSSQNPNFTNLPRDDKRVKSCIVARPGKVFVGADYSQLEPRVFAALSGDDNLKKCFSEALDFYSVVGAPVFGITGVSLKKEDPNSLAKKYPSVRDKSKVIALATPYGRTAHLQASQLGISREEAQEVINSYFEAWPKVELMMLESHEQVKKDGVVYSYYGRPRRIPEGVNIKKIYGNTSHSELPYVARTMLNLGMNHRIQSTAASIANRAMILFCDLIQKAALAGCKIVLFIHDEIIVECKEEDSLIVKDILKFSMENAVELPGVALSAEPKIASAMGELK